ncbi:MAG: 50S ribosomal protein L31 [Anaerolineaceae bacterium]|nr:50S ribosomal protein L31 [Anaerolineaceae bacterium]
MKEAIHPQWYAEAPVTCACGNSWTTGATVPELRTDICSRCHPFYTGEQRIVDTEGQVDRFLKRLQIREDILQEERRRRQEARCFHRKRPDVRPWDWAKRHLNMFRDQGIRGSCKFHGTAERATAPFLRFRE